MAPSRRDAGKLSTSRQARLNARAAYEHHVRVLRLRSAGTWAVSAQEVLDAGSRAVDDSAVADSPAAGGHTYVDFRPFSRGAVTEMSARLLVFALARGAACAP